MDSRAHFSQERLEEATCSLGLELAALLLAAVEGASIKPFMDCVGPLIRVAEWQIRPEKNT